MNLVGNGVSWALYFAFYGRLKTSLEAHHGSLSFYDYFLASGAAGAFYHSYEIWELSNLTIFSGALTAICTNPIWVIKTRMLSTSSSHPGAYTSMLDGTRQIFRSEGLVGFYRGLVPSLFGISHGALQFMAYEQLKIYRIKGIPEGQKDLKAIDFLVLSGVAKVFAGSITYPYQVIRTRLQMYDADSAYRGASDVIRKVWRREGLTGFYKGLGLNMVRVLPSTWVTFLVYEKMKVYVPQILEPSIAQ